MPIGRFTISPFQGQPEVRSCTSHKGEVTYLAISPEGRHLATASADQTVKVWDAETGAEILTLVGHTAPVAALVFRPGGRQLAAGATDGSIRVWDLHTGREHRTLRGRSAPVIALAFNPDGTSLASGGTDRMIALWDVERGRQTDTFRGHEAQILCLRFSPDGQELASSSQDGTVRLWAVTRCQEAQILPERATSYVAFRQGERTLVSLGGRETTVWDLEAGQPIRRMTQPSIAPKGVSRNGKVSCGVVQGGVLQGRIKVWDVDSSKEWFVDRVHSPGVWPLLLLSSDGLRLAGAERVGPTGPSTVKLWDVVSQRETVVEGAPAGVRALAFSPKGDLLAAGGEQVAHLWKVRTGKRIQSIPATSRTVTSLAFNSDGQLLSVGCSDLSIVLWEVATGKKARTLRGQSSAPTCLIFSPDGSRLASGHVNGAIVLWNVQTGHRLLALQAHPGDVNSLAFSHDGQLLASGTGSEGVRIWDARPFGPAGVERDMDRQAIDLLTFLFRRPLSQRDVLGQIRSNQAITDAVRHRAFALLPRFKEETNPRAYHASAQRLVCLPHLSAWQYRLARSQAQTACRMAPNDPACRATLGAAEYRLGEYVQAVAMLARVVEQQEKMPGGPSAESIAFLAMALKKSGKQADARAALTRLRALVQRKKGANTGDFDLLRDAESQVQP